MLHNAGYHIIYQYNTNYLLMEFYSVREEEWQMDAMNPPLNLTMSMICWLCWPAVCCASKCSNAGGITQKSIVSKFKKNNNNKIDTSNHLM